MSPSPKPIPATWNESPSPGIPMGPMILESFSNSKVFENLHDGPSGLFQQFVAVAERTAAHSYIAYMDCRVRDAYRMPCHI